MKNSLRIDGVYAAYKKEAIRGVSLSARCGQVIALIGPNGAGKSTLFRIVAGFVQPLKGRVMIDGRDVSRLAPHQRVQMGLGYLMQGGQVFPSLTVQENLEMAALGLKRDERAERVLEIAETLDLKWKLNGRASTLSGGAKQRLALAMILVKRPSLLLLDEPSAGLSPVMTRHVFQMLNQYRQSYQITILLVEQNIQEALKFAQRAMLLVNGRIVAETKQPDTWLEEGQLDALFWGQTMEASL